MAHGHFQKLEHSQKQILAAILQQNIQIFLLNSMDLVDEINAKLNDNPFLEVEEEPHKTFEMKDIPKYQLKKETGEIHEEDFENYRKEIYEDSDSYFEKRTNTRSNDDNSKQAFLENTITHNSSLYDDLKSQLKALKLNSAQEDIADIIFSCLDDYGILRNSIEEIASFTRSTVKEVETVLERLQELDPPGIGARNNKEYLLIQIEKKYRKESIYYKIAKDYFELFEKMEQETHEDEINPKKIEIKKVQFDAKKLKKKVIKEVALKNELKPEEVESILEKIQKTVMPSPVIDSVSSETEANYIVPDIIVTVNPIDQSINVRVFDDYLPKLKVNQDYKVILKKERGIDVTPEIKDLKTKYEEAKNFVNLIKRRNSTLYDLAAHLTEIQKEFFIKGTEYIKPLAIKDMADILRVHESTVSRIVNNKYISTPMGVYPLKFLFSHHIEGNQEDVSAKKVGEMIKKIINTEGGQKKLSDSKITKILNNMGIKISRRTVAKYRGKLNIESSFDR